MVTWQFYLGRKRVTDIRQWAAARGLLTVDDVRQFLTSVGTTQPTQAEIERDFLQLPKADAVERPVTIDSIDASHELIAEGSIVDNKSVHDHPPSDKGHLKKRGVI